MNVWEHWSSLMNLCLGNPPAGRPAKGYVIAQINVEVKYKHRIRPMTKRDASGRPPAASAIGRSTYSHTRSAVPIVTERFVKRMSIFLLTVLLGASRHRPAGCGPC